jgi:hypothetical protein
MSKTSGNVVNPLDLIDDIGVDGFRYYVLADTTYGQDGDFTYEGLIGRYNSDLANNLGNLLSRVATVVGKKCDGVGPAPRADSPLAEAAAAAWEGTADGWAEVQPSARSRPRGAHPRHQRLPRGQRAVEGRARCGGRRGDGRRARGAAHRGDPGQPGACRPRARPCGSASACPARSATSACPTPPPGAATPAASSGDQGRPAVPPQVARLFTFAWM